MEVAVIGAGIIGLSSAVAIQEKTPLVKVTIIADKFGRHTTSDGAGGIFVPWAKGVDEALNHKLATESCKHFYDLAFSSESKNSGVILASGYELMNTDTSRPFLKYLLYCDKLTPKLMERFIPYYKYGYFITTCIVECPKYLPWLMDRFLRNGGRIIEKTVESFEELADNYGLIINCTGLESVKLIPDSKLQPLRGHLLRVSAPWIKQIIHTDDDRYILPATNTVALGGVKQPGRSDLIPLPEDSKKIMEDMIARFPALKGAKVLWEWVGLRPQRETLRLEMEIRHSKGKKYKVIHNYGHGAFGISLSWGTAVYVSEMVEKVIHSQSKL